MNSLISKMRCYLTRVLGLESRETPRLLMVVMCLAAGMVWICTRAPDEQNPYDERVTVDTFVPRGFDYIPIEVENYQALDAAIGSQAIVDLYSVAQAGQKSRRLAIRVPLVRAPLNASAFGVIVKVENAPQLVQTGRFFVVVRNSQETGTEVEAPRAENQRPTSKKLTLDCGDGRMITNVCEFYKHLLIGLYLTLLTAPQMARAAYLIRAPQASRAEYEEALHEFPYLKSMVSLGSPVAAAPAQKQSLLQTLESAQLAFMSDTLETAKEQFQKVAEMALKADWDLSSRQAITYAYVRLAQLADKPEERKELIRKALVVRQNDDIDASTFPPPLVALMHAEKAQLESSAITWEPHRSFRGFDVVLINGRSVAITPTTKVQVWPGTYRITVLSNSHRAYSEVMQAANLPDLRLERIPLVTGTCENPAWTSTPPRKDVVIYYREGCLMEFSNEGFVDLSAKLDLRVLPSAAPSEIEVAARTAKPSEHRWYQNTWLWAGVAALTTGVVISMVQNQNKDPGQTVVPVHTETIQ